MIIYNSFLYGSKVYQTDDELSDTDFIIIADGCLPEEQKQFDRIDLTIWSVEKFQELLNSHDVSALECYFLPDNFAIRTKQFDFTVDLEQLRKSFSAKSSNSWVKAKKKLEVHNEYRIGLKSLFHSFRILDFGIQIATTGKIENYSSANSYWNAIQAQYDAGWNYKDYKEYYQPLYNELRTKFRLAAPMEKGNNNE